MASTNLVSKSPDEINRILAKFHPELASTYAKYPMECPKWKQYSERGPKGEPCFIRGANTGVKMDYVYCERAPEPGYYSVLCKISYVNLYAKHTGMTPGVCGCGCTAAARKEFDEWDDAHRILHARHKSRKPDDGVAARDAIAESQLTAQADYHYQQNEQCKSWASFLFILCQYFLKWKMRSTIAKRRILHRCRSINGGCPLILIQGSIPVARPF